MENKNENKPVSMFVLFARFFVIVARRLEERLGEEGLEIMRESVREWGNDRGKDIARRAKNAGQENNLENYPKYYDMERSKDFGFKEECDGNTICQEFKNCVFAQTWMEEGTEKYGKLYCENIDPSIAKGYNEDLVCEHDKIIYDDGICTFCFYMKNGEQVK